MPGMSGMDVCRFLKSDKKTNSIPVLMLTAKNDEVDRILGLELGADDYLTKPFNSRELVLRIKNILKRSSTAEDEESKAVQYGVLTVHLKNHEVMVKNKPVSLTLTEFKLLASLIVKPDQVKTRDYLLEQIWEYGDGVYSRTVDTHVQRLRAKLKDAGRYIETVRGVGYRISDEK
jgi:two-component system phosphate regulon response regulator PhoB